MLQDEVVFASPGDPPPAVVQRHVVISAQQNATIDVGSSACGVRINVMRLTIRRGPVTPSPPASAITNRERDALFRSEKSLFPPEIEWIPVGIYGDRHESALADALIGR
ncbi:hypothetical protein DC31_02085 [Microbacterium sp. CH12i]|nr:hypothetical protein DC31_02085 [Microbacterium sp. CH12i]